MWAFGGKNQVGRRIDLGHTRTRWDDCSYSSEVHFWWLGRKLLRMLPAQRGL